MSGLKRRATRALAALRGSQLSDTVEFARRFRVDGADTRRDRVLELIARLPDASEHDVSRRVSGALRHLDLAAGIRIDLASDRPKQPDDGERRIGLECVVDRVRIRGERLVDGAVGLADRARAVDIHGCADALDDRFNADVVACEPVGGGLERLVHERSHVIMRVSSAHRACARATGETIEQCHRVRKECETVAREVDRTTRYRPPRRLGART